MFFFAICDKLWMKRRWSLGKPRNVFYSLRLVSVRKPSVNCFYFTGPGLLKLRPIGSIRWLKKLRLISLGLISHLCPGLHAITNFTILCRKIAADTISRTLRLSVTSSFFPLTRRGFWIIQTLQKLRKTGTTTIFCNLFFLVPYWLVSLSRRRFRIEQILGKWPKIVVKTYLTTFRYCFVLFSLTREGLPIEPIPQKVPKIVPCPHFPIFPYVFIT